MLNISNHQDNANENHSEILSHTCLDGYYKNKQKLSVDEDTEKRETLYIVYGCVNWCNCHGKIVRNFPNKLKIELTYDPKIQHFWVYICRKQNQYFKEIAELPCSLQYY